MGSPRAVVCVRATCGSPRASGATKRLASGEIQTRGGKVTTRFSARRAGTSGAQSGTYTLTQTTLSDALRDLLSGTAGKSGTRRKIRHPHRRKIRRSYWNTLSLLPKTPEGSAMKSPPQEKTTGAPPRTAARR